MDNQDENNLSTNSQEFEIWLENGIKNKWITEPFCATHEGDPYMSEEESAEWEDGGDPCLPVVKIII